MPNFFRAVLPVVAAGVLLAFSLPPFNVAWLGWFAIALLLIAVRRCHPLRALELGMLTSGVCGVIHVGWISSFSRVPAYTPFLWLMLLLGTVSVAAAIARQRQTKFAAGVPWVLFVASVGVAAEWLTTFSPLPLHLALSQYRAQHLIQIASFTGIWGVSFLIYFVNAALADAVLQRRFPTAPLGLAAALIALANGFGTIARRLNDAGSSRLPVAAIQDNGSKDAREALTRDAVVQGARLIVWPEYCLGRDFQPQDRNDPTLRLARQLKTYLVVGYFNDAQPKPNNCVALIGPDGSVQGIYKKIHLYGSERRLVQPGQEATAFDTDIGRIGMEICFDNCFTGVTRRIAQAGAQLVVLPTSDPVVQHHVLEHLHAAVLPFRAVENRVPFVQTNNRGLSQIVDATGHITTRAPLAVPIALMGAVSLGGGRGTFFTRYGDWLVYFCLLVVGIGALIQIQQRRLENTVQHEARETII